MGEWSGCILWPCEVSIIMLATNIEEYGWFFNKGNKQRIGTL
jgi:hypothetical protein